MARRFDFSKYKKHKIALMVAYLGWDYDGLVVQRDTDNTVEEMVLRGLEKTKIIENRSECGWSRCGRTDKGVSGFKQVFSFVARSKSLATASVGSMDKSTEEQELDYVGVLNRVLPVRLRVLSWAPVPDSFDARHSCNRRLYKYFFPRGKLNIDSMLQAGQHLIGTHDFRNFCKLALNSDKTDVKATVKTVDSVEIKHTEQLESDSSYDMFVLEIGGTGFLYHQVRCIVALLLEVGNGVETPDLIEALLDVDKHPSKPQYAPAYELPLILFDTSFEEAIDWQVQSSNSSHTVAHMQRIWAEHQIKATMIKHMIDNLQKNSKAETTNEQTSILYPGPRSKNYVAICQRKTGDGPDEKRRKIESKLLKTVSQAIS